MAALISPGALLFHPHHAGEREKGWLWVDDTSPYFKSRITNALLARRLMNADWRGLQCLKIFLVLPFMSKFLKSWFLQMICRENSKKIALMLKAKAEICERVATVWGALWCSRPIASGIGWKEPRRRQDGSLCSRRHDVSIISPLRTERAHLKAPDPFPH